MAKQVIKRRVPKRSSSNSSSNSRKSNSRSNAQNQNNTVKKVKRVNSNNNKNTIEKNSGSSSKSSNTNTNTKSSRKNSSSKSKTNSNSKSSRSTKSRSSSKSNPNSKSGLSKTTKSNSNNKKRNNNFAFIDGQNLYQGVSASGWQLDYFKFREYLKEKYNVSKAYFFMGFIEGNSSLYNYLQEAGFIMVFKQVVEINNKNGETDYKGNVDTELVLQAMIQYENFDKAVIVTGDGDFHSLLDYFEKNNKLERLIVPSGTYSSHLKKFSGKLTPIYTFKKKVEK